MAVSASALAPEPPEVTTEFLNALASVHSLAETKRMTDMVGCLPTGAGMTRLEYA